MKKIFKLILLSLLIAVAGKAQIKLVGNITTNGVAAYPTHIDSLGKGGYMTIPTITERDNIPILRRKYGMLVYVQANDSLYKLSSINLDNSNWITMGLASVLKLANDSLLVYTKIKSDSTTLAGRISALGNTVAGDIANVISGSTADLAAEVTRATNAENALSARITTNSTNIASNTSSITNLTATINAATSSNTANTIALRDANGNFSAGIITASLAGNASTTTKLAASKNIYGNAFDGTADLTQAIAGAYGGTGINNGNNTITLGGNILTANSFTTVGNYSTTLTSTGVTDITLPTTGTIATLAGTETLTNKTIVSPNLTGIPTAPTASAGTNTTQLATTAFVSAVETGLGSRIDVNTTNINSNTLSIGTNATNIAANTTAINNRVSFSDMPTFLLPYLKIDDTLNMLSVYRAAMIDNNSKIESLIADTATLITRFGLKENISNKSTDVSADGTSNTKYPTVKSVKDFVDATITAATPDATTTSKGKIQLYGDLTGIAASPTVNSVGGSSSTTIHTAELLANAATDANTANTIVKRDATGNFSAGNISASLTGNVSGNLTGNVTGNVVGNLTGNASTASTLATTKNIYGNPFDGSVDLTQAILGTYGGTGINNGNKTITLGGNILTANDFITAGNYSTTLTSTGITNITLPTTGTIATLAGTETLTNKTIESANLTGVPTAPTAAAGTSTTQIATTEFVTSTTSAATPDASTTVKGKVQLAGDLGGIATSPTVNTVGGSTSSTIHTAELLANAATDANNLNSIVKRDGSGNFSAGSITAALIGNASTATTLAANKNIYGNAFDGSADLTQAIAGTFGGTGINNGSKTITLGGNILTASDFTTAGNFSTTLTSTGLTNITLPTTGTIATLAGTETLTNKTIASAILTGVPTAPTAAAGTSNTQVATTAFVTATTSAATPDASTTVKGKVQLAGDLGGIATSPTVNTVGGSTSSTIHTAELLANAATDANTASAIVKRDANGDFSAGVITADLLGTSTNVTGIILGANGGTGINNTGKTITLGGNILTANSFTTAGNYNTTLTSTGATNITLPTTGTIATLAGTETLTNKTIVNANLTGIPTAPTATAGTNNTQLATTAFVTATTSAATPDASTTVKGKVQLAGDLGGIATSPTVNTVGGSSSTTIHTAELLANAATDVNTPNAIVKRDASGNFIAGNIAASLTGDVTGNLTGNATTATTAGNITATSNTTLTSLSNLNTVGTITSGIWSATIIDVAHGGTGLATTSQNYIFAGPTSGSGAPSFRQLTSADVPAGSGNYIFNSTSQQSSSNFNISGSGVIGTSLTAGSLTLTTALSPSSGGSGVNNGNKTITLGGNFLTGGNFSTIGSSALVLRTLGATDLTLPTSGTLATLSDISGSTIGGAQITGVILPLNGGTGIANAQTNTITLGGPLVTTGNGTITLNSSGAGSTITLPTTGTIATLAGTETLTNKTIVDLALTGVPTAPTASAGTSTNQIATTAFVNATTTAATPDASSTVKGKVQLAGDLGGTATSPTVNTVGGSTSTTIHTAELLANAATNLNTASTIVKRDASGNFNAGTITGNLSGNATTATTAGNITATSNTTLTSLVNLNTVGTITSGVWSATTIDVAHGGTGATTTSQNFIFAGPTSGAGAPTFRALTSADVPAGSGSYIANGTTQQANANFNISGNGVVGGDLTASTFTVPAGLSTQFLKANGTLDATTYATAGANANITSLTGLTTALSLTQGGTGSTTKNFVDLTTAQTIAGAKTFSSTATFNTDIKINGLNVGAGPNAGITTNTVFGKNALVNSSTSDYNTAIGYRALNSNDATAFGNTAVGANAINLNTTGQRNTAVGESAMTKNTTGNSNTAVGEYALRDNSVGSDNTSVGNFALASNIGSKNTAIGSGANTTSTTIENTTAIGYGATVTASNTIQLGNTDITSVMTSGNLKAGTVTYPNTHNGIANQVLSIDASGNASFNSLGAAGATLTNGKILVGNASNIGTEVTVSGDVSMTNTGVININAGVITTTDIASSAITYAKLQNITTGKLLGSVSASAVAPGEVTIGSGLALSSTGTLTASGSGGTVTNVSALTLGTTGTDVNSTVANSTTTPTITLNIPDASATARGLVTTGAQAFAGSKTFNSDIVMGSARIGLGGGSGGNGGRNIAMGINALQANTTGQWNVALGAYALQAGATASSNVAVGNEVMSISAPGSSNTGVGNRSLLYTTGSSNTAIGASSGATITTGSNNTFIGASADADVIGRTNATAIGNGAIVTADNSFQLGNASITNIKTAGTLTAGAVTYPNAHNSIANQVLTINSSGTASWAPNSSASLAGGVAGAIPYQSGVGVTGYTAAGTSGQILTSAGTGTPTWITTLPVANGGTGATTLTSNAVLLGNGTGAVQTVAPGTSGNILTSNGTTWTSVAASSSGVTTLGNISATSNAKGATISGTTLTLTAADGTNGGVVTTAAQTFAGTKSFADVNVSGALNGNSSASSTIAGFNAAISTVTTALTITSANAATYNGKVLVCSGSAFTVTFDSTVPVGFSCMILQSDNNTISFSGTNNRYNYSSTSGIYAIATAMCYASGAVLLTGDLQ